MLVNQALLVPIITISNWDLELNNELIIFILSLSENDFLYTMYFINL